MDNIQLLVTAYRTVEEWRKAVISSIAFFEAIAVVCGEGAFLVGVPFVVQGFFPSGGRKCVYLDVFMVVSKDLMWA